jgi:hypothetical protein
MPDALLGNGTKSQLRFFPATPTTSGQRTNNRRVSFLVVVLVATVAGVDCSGRSALDVVNLTIRDVEAPSWVLDVDWVGVGPALLVELDGSVGPVTRNQI